MPEPAAAPARRPGRWRWPALLVAGLGIGLSVSCTHLGYYAQSLVGGAKVLAKRRDVAKVIADESTPEALRRQLEAAQRMRDFAVTDLGLPDNESYRTYVALDRPYAVWNVVAAPELSLEPKTWCFAIAGCVAYRGYFSEQRAEKFADKLRRGGFDVDVGGVAAYSTAGWFADPLLSTFIERSDAFLAGLIFHELAHEVVYVKNDSTFNESFAMTVEQEGAVRWLAERGLEEEMASYRRFKSWERQFTELVFAYRGRLADIFAAPESDEWKRRRKAETFAELRAAYEETKAGWGGYAGFDGWFSGDVDNADLALIGVYHQMVPAFEELLERQGGRLEPFYGAVRELAALAPAERARRLQALLPAKQGASPETPGLRGPDGR
jgi:predicted aminopeptidase